MYDMMGGTMMGGGMMLMMLLGLVLGSFVFSAIFWLTYNWLVGKKK